MYLVSYVQYVECWDYPILHAYYLKQAEVKLAFLTRFMAKQAVERAYDRDHDVVRVDYTIKFYNEIVESGHLGNDDVS